MADTPVRPKSPEAIVSLDALSPKQAKQLGPLASKAGDPGTLEVSDLVAEYGKRDLPTQDVLKLMQQSNGNPFTGKALENRIALFRDYPSMQELQRAATPHLRSRQPSVGDAISAVFAKLAQIYAKHAVPMPSSEKEIYVELLGIFMQQGTPAQYLVEAFVVAASDANIPAQALLDTTQTLIAIGKSGNEGARFVKKVMDQWDAKGLKDRMATLRKAPDYATLSALRTRVASLPQPLRVGGTLGSIPKLHQAHNNKPTVFLIWASWCSPCAPAMEDAAKLRDDFAAQGIQFMGVVADNESPSALRNKRAKTGANWERDIALPLEQLKLLPSGIPALIFTNAKGEIVDMQRGYSSGTLRRATERSGIGTQE